VSLDVPREDASDLAALGVVAFTTTREAGTFGMAGRDPVADVMGRWWSLVESLGAYAPRLATSRQVHGNRVLVHRLTWEGWLRADAADGHVEAVEAGLDCLDAPPKPGPGCGDLVQTCKTEPSCIVAYTCATTYCLTQPTLSEFVSCGIVCATDAGIASLTDPAAQTTYAVFRCAVASCKAFCPFAQSSDGG